MEAFPAPAIPVGRPDETLHKAIDAMVAELDGKAGGDRSGWAGTQLCQLLTLKANHEDVALAAIDAAAIRRMAEYWMARPKKQGSNEPVAGVTARR